MTAINTVPPSKPKVSQLVSPRERAGNHRLHIARPCINNVIRSEICLDASKTGDVWQPDMTDVHTYFAAILIAAIVIYWINES